jgi:hypothetical protein
MERPIIPYRALRGFFGAYLHEDWDLDAESPTDLVAVYITDAGLHVGFEMLGEIQVILAGNPSEEDLALLLGDLGSRYMPLSTDGGVRPFLEEVAGSALFDIHRKVLAT